MKVVGIRVKDERTYKKIAKELEALNIPFINLNRVPSADIAIVLTDDQGKGISVGRNVKRAIKGCLRAYSGRFREIVIGIDPGPRPGIAVFGDEREIYSCIAESPEKAAAFVKKITEMYEHESCVIRIGDGAKVYRNRIINRLLPLRIEIVDERRTSGMHMESAKKIAFLNGTVIKEEIRQEFEEGELKEIQNESRSISGITISKELAKEVAEGKIDMKKAIKKQNKRRKNK